MDDANVSINTYSCNDTVLALKCNSVDFCKYFIYFVVKMMRNCKNSTNKLINQKVSLCVSEISTKNFMHVVPVEKESISKFCLHISCVWFK